MPYSDITDDVKDQLVELLESKDFKSKLLKELNDDVDIPLINEKTEKKVLEKIYKVIIKSIKSIELN